MALSAHLHPNSILLAPQADSKWDLINQMVDCLIGGGQLEPHFEAAALKNLKAREESVSTGMEQGIAVPHAAMDDLEHLVAAMALLPEGLDFQSLDGNPAQIVVLLLVPKTQKLQHVQTLTEIARRLADPTFRTQLLGLSSRAEVVQAWA
jgi:mannitol/fructose-specific phosphotransferase system IIA component (Ntr-type)